jgi:hypothetical protein
LALYLTAAGAAVLALIARIVVVSAQRTRPFAERARLPHPDPE